MRQRGIEDSDGRLYWGAARTHEWHHEGMSVGLRDAIEALRAVLGSDPTGCCLHTFVDHGETGDDPLMGCALLSARRECGQCIAATSKLMLLPRRARHDALVALGRAV